MRREKILNRDGFYAAVVDNNVLMHREVIEQGPSVLTGPLQSRGDGDAVRLLDLACGGMPVSIAEIMDGFPHLNFHYAGVDINPDQIESARGFRFSANVKAVDLREGSAWNLSGLDLAGSFDCVFIGLNLHHGTPEEIAFLGSRIHALLVEDGGLLNHDWYRPNHEPYLRRAPRPLAEISR